MNTYKNNERVDTNAFNANETEPEGLEINLLTNFNENPRIPIHEKREKVNEKLFAYFKEFEKKGLLKEGGIGLLNHLFDNIPSKIVPSDLQSIELIKNPPELTLLNNDTNSNFSRFYIKLNLADTTKLSYKLQSHYAAGMNIPLIVDDTLISLIISPNNPNFLIHELAHSIDPYEEEREGINKILNECIGYYTEVLYPIVMMINGKENRVKSQLLHIKNSIQDKIYWQQFELDKEMTYEEYQKEVERVISLLQNIENKIGKRALFIKMLNTKTIEELIKGY